MIARWLFWVAYEWSLIAAALYAASEWPWLIPLAVLVVGSRQHALGVLGHETAHWSLLPDNHQLNDRLGNWLCMWALGSTVQAFRSFHLRHHVYLNTDQDSERMQREAFFRRWRNLTPSKKARLIAGDLIGANVAEPFALMLAVGGRWTWTRGAYCVALVTLVYSVGGVLPLAIWVLALFTANFAAMRARMWREHLGAEDTERYVAAWWERAVYLPHYIWKHADHHSPGRWNVPCWRLRDL